MMDLQFLVEQSLPDAFSSTTLNRLYFATVELMVGKLQAKA